MTLPCPLPVVEEKLSPYIHTRQDTLHIRQLLTEPLAAGLCGKDKQLSYLALACPTTDTESGATPENFCGLRERYIEALQADITARKKFDAVTAELNELREANISEERPSSESGSSQDDLTKYISLLRQRRRYEKLQVIQQTLDELAGTSVNATRADVKSMVIGALGEPPEPPHLNARQEVGASSVYELTFRLKKEMLGAKQRMDLANRLRAETHEHASSGTNPGLEAQVDALRVARDELVNWIEGELAKIPEDSSMINGESRGTKHDNDPKEDAALTDAQTYFARIQKAYGQYVAARQSLVATIEATRQEPLQPSSPQKTTDEFSLTEPPKGTDTREIRASDALPFFPHLLQISQDERSLLQQSTYLRRQLSAATSENARLIEHLADESHLVTPGVRDAKAWAAAAEAASRTNNALVKEHLECGEHAVASAEHSLAEMHAQRNALGRFSGNM